MSEKTNYQVRKILESCLVSRECLSGNATFLVAPRDGWKILVTTTISFSIRVHRGINCNISGLTGGVIVFQRSQTLNTNFTDMNHAHKRRTARVWIIPQSEKEMSKKRELFRLSNRKWWRWRLPNIWHTLSEEIWSIAEAHTDCMWPRWSRLHGNWLHMIKLSLFRLQHLISSN